MMNRQYTYGKNERLKSRKLMDELFARGKVIKSYPVRIHYLVHKNETLSPLQAGVSVSKRNFKKAVDRNRVKRLLRESYRLHNLELKEKYTNSDKNMAIMIIYGSNKMPVYKDLEKQVKYLLRKLSK